MRSREHIVLFTNIKLLIRENHKLIIVFIRMLFQVDSETKILVQVAYLGGATGRLKKGRGKSEKGREKGRESMNQWVATLPQ